MTMRLMLLPLLLSAALSFPPEAMAQTQTAQRETRAADLRTRAEALVEHINHARTLAGVTTLQIDTTLMQAAARRAAELTQTFRHDRPNGSAYHTVLDEFGLSHSASAENIAHESSGNASAVHEQFMHSPGHRTNLLNDHYTHIGIGVFRNDMGYYWVELFAAKTKEKTHAQ